MNRKVLSILLLSVSLNYICCYLMSLVQSRGILRAIKARSSSLQPRGKTQQFSKQIRNTALKCLDADSQIICNEVEASVWDNLYKNVFSDAKTEVKCLLAVSGGSDSIAMLHIFKAIKDTYKVNLSLDVINFNHKARPESDEEVLHSLNLRRCAPTPYLSFISFCLQAQFVSSLAAECGLPYHTVELPERLRVKTGFQEIARDWRRKECERILSEQAHTGPAYICTAHNSDDQNETMMLKLLRGVHLSNFQPVCWRRIHA